MPAESGRATADSVANWRRRRRSGRVLSVRLMAVCHDPMARPEPCLNRQQRQNKVNPSAHIRDYLDTLVHPSVRDNEVMAVRHRAFIAPRLFGSLISLGILPVFLAVRGVPTVMEFVLLAWMIAPISTAYYLSRTGGFELAHMMSALALTAIVTIVAMYSGGINSFAAVWLVLIPLEAALAASRRVVAVAALLALGAAGLLLLVGPQFAASSSPVEANGTLAALGVVSAALYAAGIALGAEQVERTNARLLSDEEEERRLLAENMTDVITRHGRNGRVLYASPNALALLGASPGELQGHGLFDRVHIADRPAFLTALSGAAADGEARNVEFRVRRTVKDGDAETVRFAWIEMSCRRPKPVERPGADTAAGEVVAVMHDIDRRKAKHEALIAARAEAVRSNAAKSRFLAVMSHELRTPLNAVIGFSEMLSEETHVRVDDARRREYARLINESGRHLLEVVNRVLEVSRLETGEFEITAEPFNPVTVIAKCRELFDLKARDAGVELKCETANGLPDVVGDKRAVKQILVNLVSNAIKFTPRGGVVSLGARIDGADVIFSVQDTGIGIATEDLARLGDPFFQAHGSYARKHEGTGLGLSIVKGLVDLHGGRLDIRSRPGEGTSVAVRLPLDCERVRATQPVRDIASRKRTETPRSIQSGDRPAADVSEPTVKKRSA